jgi:RNA polymerase sigma factor (sigma-70 family)
VFIRKGGVVRRQVQTLFNLGAIRDLTDGQLLERFATEPSEVAELAFAVLVERHGPMVLRVCRGLLLNADETQDAFQATFLVLVKKARGLWVRQSLGPWLYQVAYRTASCARLAAARRSRHERAVAQAREEGREDLDRELVRILHEEIERLPERFRTPIVLCDLEGRTHEEAARAIGVPIGTLKSRQSRARERLRERLGRRGHAPQTGVIVSALGSEPPSAALLDSTTRAAVQCATSRTLIRGVAASLAQEVLRTMITMQVYKIASALLVLGATVSGVTLLAQDRGRGGSGGAVAQKPAQAEEQQVFTVKPGPLRVDVIERGSIEASLSSDVFCLVEGTTTIMSILPEGSAVKKGDLVCELDSATLKDKLTNQEIATRSAEAAYQNAKLIREIAEIARTEYTEGIFRQEQSILLGEIARAEDSLRRLESKVKRTQLARKQLDEVLARKDPIRNASEIVADLTITDSLEEAQASLERDKVALEVAHLKRNVLEKYTSPKTTKELKANVESRRSDELAKEATWSLMKATEAKLKKQIANCKMYAPSDGILVYANDPGRVNRVQIQIEEGASVRERQKIFSIPDLNRPMRVNVKVREAFVDRLKPGNRARVVVDSFPGVTLTGVVRRVAPLPDVNLQFANTNVKVYSTLVELEKELPGLRPGMSAQADILVSELDNVLTVPLTSVVNLDGKFQVGVKTREGAFEFREITLGQANDEYLEVKSGLREGDSVTLNPLGLLSEEEKQTRLKASPPRASRKAAEKAQKR